MKTKLSLAILLVWAFASQAAVVVTPLYSFTGSNLAAGPYGGLVQGSDGDFYGTVSKGGTNGLGTVFRITEHGVFTDLHSFTADDGADPSGLVQGSDGNFYGVTAARGLAGWGTVFKITATGVFTKLYSFMGGSDGGSPRDRLVQGSDGNFYGTTYARGAYGAGTIFTITTNGIFTPLHWLTTAIEGQYPSAALMQGHDGGFYGTTGWGGTNNHGSVFKITTHGVFSNLYSFALTKDAWSPNCPNGLTQGSDGHLYGTGYYGGTNGPSGYGTVFKITTNGAYTSLYSFTGGNDGSRPYAGLMQAADGSFYGTTSWSGAYSNGTIFKITTNGVFTILYSFTGGDDGAYPQSALVQGRDGSFYGTTSGAGGNKIGTVFRMTTGLAFTSITLTNRMLILRWSADAGSKYQLQYLSELRPGNWINLGNPVTATGSTQSALDSVGNITQRFYRVVRLPQ